MRESAKTIRIGEGPGVPLFVHDEWSSRFPWLVQGTTGRGTGEPFDLGLSGEGRVGIALGRWWQLREALGAATLTLPRQMHGNAILTHHCATRGIQLAGRADGHITARANVVLAVTVADCVPVSIVEPETRTVALLHAGWRGTAAGVLEAGIRMLRAHASAPAERLWLHLGPAICGDCYEVGPEVHHALGLVTPPAPEAVDLRAVLAARARSAGIPVASVSRSAWCTRCDTPRFFSHRGGDAGRQVGVLGIQETDSA